MKLVKTTSCSGCGRSYPIHRLWCVDCDRPTSTPVDIPAVRPGESRFEETIEFCERVLDDLKALSRRGEVRPQLYRTIRDFYTGRLKRTLARREASQKASAIENHILAARTLALVNDDLTQALASVQSSLVKFPGEASLREMSQEISERTLKNVRDRQVRQLCAAAKTCLADFRALSVDSPLLKGGNPKLKEAEGKLREALDLDPENRKIQSELAKVQDLIERQALVAERRTHVERGDRVREPAERQTATKAPATEALKERSGPPDALVTRSGRLPVARPAQREKEGADVVPKPPPSFAPEDEIPSPTQRLIEAFSDWSRPLKPFLLDNVGWFVAAFLIITGCGVLIATFWKDIEGNLILQRFFLFLALFFATGIFFSLAYFMRIKYPELDTSSNVLLIIVALLTPLVFVSAVLITMVPA